MTTPTSPSSASHVETLHIGAMQIDIVESMKNGRAVKTARVSGNDILPKDSLVVQAYGGNPQHYDLLPVDILGVNQRHYRIKLPDDSFIELRINHDPAHSSALQLIGRRFARKNPKAAPRKPKHRPGIATIEFLSKHHVARRNDGLPTSYLVELNHDTPLRVVERWHLGNQYAPNAQGVIERLTHVDGTPMGSETLLYGERGQFRVRRTIIQKLGFKIAAEVWVMNDRYPWLRHSPTLWPRLQPEYLEQNKERKKWRLTRRYSPSSSRIARFIVTHLVLGGSQDEAREYGWPVLNDEAVPMRAQGSRWRKGKRLGTYTHPPLYTGAKPTGPA